MKRFSSFFLTLGAVALLSSLPASGYAKQKEQQPKLTVQKDLTSKHHHSSSSSSSDCSESRPDADKIKAPPYIKVKNGRPQMQIGVLNRTSLISHHLLKEVLEVVSKQVKEDFAPFYGITVKFKVFKDNNSSDWLRYVPLVIDDFLATDCGCISFHAFQAPGAFNGPPIGEYVFNPPILPNGTPYIVIPMGDSSTDYGVVPASLSGDPTLPPTFDTIFSNSVSHEVLETLHNYTTNLWTLNANGNIDSINEFINEVCDPVESTPGYVMCGYNVSNFVLPSYWTYLSTGPYDFLNTVSAPFTPFAGEQSFIQVGPCGAENFVIVSLPIPFGDPTMPFIVDLGPVFSTPCCPTAASQAVDLLKGAKALTQKSCCGKSSFGPRVHKRAGLMAKQLERKAA